MVTFRSEVARRNLLFQRNLTAETRIHILLLFDLNSISTAGINLGEKLEDIFSAASVIFGYILK